MFTGGCDTFNYCLGGLKKPFYYGLIIILNYENNDTKAQLNQNDLLTL